MTDVGFTWNGLEITDDNEFTLGEFEGWMDWPSAGRASQPATFRHGELLMPVHVPARTITASGELGPADRKQLLQTLGRAMDPPPDPTVPLVASLVGTVEGVTRTADAQLLRYRPILDKRLWVGGIVPWEAQWVCSDPYLYEDWISVTVPLATELLGVLIPTTGPFTLPDSPFGGTVALVNPGESASPAEYILTGPMLAGGGVRNDTTGRQVTIDYPLAAGDVLTIWTGPRTSVQINGIARETSDGSDPTSRLVMAPGPNLIRALGIPGVGAPLFTARVRPAFPRGV